MSRSLIAAAACVLACIDPAAAQPSPDEQVQGRSLEELMSLEIASVYGAARRDQRVTDAPAAVTVITASDIATYGWRTFADVLRNVRGFYITYDRNYSYLGVRGFGRPTDYNNRVLLLVDGHRLNDNVYDAALLGTEFPISLDLIERVELIRGPGSALYGTNAFFAVINVITRRGGGLAGIETSIEVGSQEVVRTTASYGVSFGAANDALLSVSHERSAGESELFFPEFVDSPSGGFSSNNDDDGATRVFANLLLGKTRLQAGFSRRGKDIPTGAYGTLMNDGRNRTVDARAWADVARPVSFGATTGTVRVFVDHFTYDGTYAFEEADNVQRDLGAGDWVGGEVLLNRSMGRHRLLVGGEHRSNLRHNQWTYYTDDGVRVLDAQSSSWQSALFAQDEIALHPRLTAIVGARYDYWNLAATRRAPTPRLGVVYQPDADTSIKVLYGRAFRAPNLYELQYNDTATLPNPSLEEETLATTELVAEHYVHSRLRLSANVFRTSIDDLISQGEVTATVFQHQNQGRARSRGAGLEAEARWPGGAHARASYSFADAVDRTANERLSNSPQHGAFLSVAIPWANRALTTALDANYTGARLTLAGRELSGVWLVNTNVTARPFGARVQFSAGVQNLLDTRYEQPVGFEFTQDALEQNGRTASLRAVVRF